jgi:hypothetical protein
MARMHYGRLILGALVAGVVLNVGDFVVGTFITADDMQRLVQRLSLNPATVNAPGVGITWVVVDFIYAALIVWTYVAVRPRFGPGPQTAVVASVVIYLAVTVVLFGFQAMGIFTPDLFIKSAACQLVTTILAGLAGASVYQES